MRTLVTVWLVALCLLSATSCFDNARLVCAVDNFLNDNGDCVLCRQTAPHTPAALVYVVRHIRTVWRQLNSDQSGV